MARSKEVVDNIVDGDGSSIPLLDAYESDGSSVPLLDAHKRNGESGAPSGPLVTLSIPLMVHLPSLSEGIA
jgi:hypothetical protein